MKKSMMRVCLQKQKIQDHNLCFKKPLSYCVNDQQANKLKIH